MRLTTNEAQASAQCLTGHCSYFFSPGSGKTCHHMRVNETTKPALASSQTEAGPLILQAFAWDMAPDASHWRYLAQHARAIADLGVTIIWLPPATRDTRESTTSATVSTICTTWVSLTSAVPCPRKYGTRDEYLAAIEALHEAGIAVCADIVSTTAWAPTRPRPCEPPRSTPRTVTRRSASPRRSRRGHASRSRGARARTRTSRGTGRASTASTG